MAMEISGKRAAISLGLLFAVLHIVWVVLVTATGGGIMGWWHSVHFVTGVTLTALPFDVLTFIVGIVGAFIMGAVVGWLFAFIWSKMGE
ncbi:MAG: hypothetical protein WC350_02565 [Candidatus Micrarchaeia archaeon]|jgi:hypothetical protein